MKSVCCFATAILWAMSSLALAAGDVGALLETLQAVGPKGAGNVQAQRAWQQLARCNAKELPRIIAALDDAGPLAANWIGTAVDAIAQRQLQAGGKLPTAELEKFVLDTGHAPRPRRLAYDWLLRADDSARARLIPGMLNDPCPEMRSDAVGLLAEQARELVEAKKTDQAVALYQRAFDAARDFDQIGLLAKRLEELGHKPDLQRHFGFIVEWKVVGPFDNVGEKGFDTAYPPEVAIDTAAEHQGKHASVKWLDHTSNDDHGKIDLNKLLGKEKEVAGYATCVFNSNEKQQVQVRITSFNAVKLWINGRLIDSHKVYHGGSQLDQYTSTPTLKAGKNVFLLKVCQNEQTQTWAEPWGFQLRVCDEVGTAILDAEKKQ